ncbi:MAG: LacI family transcriptional regulator [Pseudonocardiales bacterium]|nr:MAG: LacI family transcriptional regulator [Pseudonocardiales bacterium]
MTTTIHDVARHANVSAATVSRVLNSRTDVASHLTERVLASVATLRYRPNGAARSLRTRATTVLGVIISDITNPFFTSMVRGVEDAAQTAGYSVVLANTDEDLDKERRYLEVAVAEQLAGVVLSPASSHHTRLDVLTDRGIPVVTVDRRLRDRSIDSVTVNNYRAAFDATGHLLEQGCRRVGVIAGPAATTTGSRRLAGYRAALRAFDVADDPAHVVHGDFRIDGGRSATLELLARGEVDGLLVSNNLMTIGALEALAQTGHQIPDDLAVVGFDDMAWAGAMRPPLTVVTQPTYEIGRRTADLLLRRIRGEELPPQRIVLPATLAVRQSSLRAAPMR